MSIATPERVKALTDAMIEGKHAPKPDEPAGVDASKRSTITSSLTTAVAIDADGGARPARPLSRVDYFARLKTFRDASAWFDKPSSLDAPTCAARGWMLEARDLLRCETCEALLAYPGCESLRDDETAMQEVETAMCEALVSTHERGCAWRETTCGLGARMFPSEDEPTTRIDFANRVDGIAKSGGRVPVCVELDATVPSPSVTSLGLCAEDSERVKALLREAREHAAESNDDADDDDLTPLERRAVVEYATEMALFGWSPEPVVIDDCTGMKKSQMAYACALCGVRAPEWSFTSIAATRKRHAPTSAQKSSAKRAKTTVATLRGAAGGSYGLGSPENRASPAEPRTPFSPVTHEKKTTTEQKDDEQTPKSKKTAIRWIAATANIASKLTMSIAGGRADAMSPVANASPFGATAASTALFGSPRPVTTPSSADEQTMTTTPTKSSLDGSKFASVVVAAVTKARAAKKRVRVSTDENAAFEVPADAARFNPSAEHHGYCPWICTKIQGRDVKPGWRSTLDVLIPKGVVRDASTRAKNFTVVDLARAREMVRKYIS
jgi:hypothetical protein